MNRDRFSGAGRFPRYLFSATKFLIFFALIAFVVTCSFLLFLDSMRLDPDILRENALLTFLNILLLSALFTVIDGIRRRLTVERPVRRIRAATQRIIQGDFSVRIEPLHGPERADAFDAIIEDFNQMARELSGVETLRTDFIANVSHELKTPLAVIQNYGSLLQDPALPKEQRVEYAKAVTDASRRLADLIANILKLNKLENQQIDLFLQAVTEARKNSDFVAAYVHWGTENTAVLETAQREQARQYIEAGADIVVGAHPHCLQGFAFEHGKHVAYSLGNFWFNMDTVETGFLSVRITAPGEYSVQFEPCIQHGGRTTLMEDAEGAALLQYLRALSPGVRIYADGTLELEQPEL